MTTITIKNSQKNFTKTSFDDAEKLLNYLLEFLYFDKDLPELSTEEIAEAKKAKKEWRENPAKFSKAVK